VSGRDFIRSGKLGTLGMVRCFVHNGGGAELPLPTVDVPKELDWDLWCGPAPLRPFNPTSLGCAGIPPEELEKFSKGGYAVCRPGSWDPVERLKDMDFDGLGAEIFYPTGHYADIALRRQETILVEDFSQTNYPSPRESQTPLSAEIGLTSALVAPLSVLMYALGRKTTPQQWLDKPHPALVSQHPFRATP